MATMAGEMNVKLRHLEDRVTVTVTVTTEFKLRFWIAKALLRTAAWLMHAGIEIKRAE